jgi:hypothetical protein
LVSAICDAPSSTLCCQRASCSLDSHLTYPTLCQSLIPSSQQDCAHARDQRMCILDHPSYDSDGPDYPLSRARPRVAWVVPVNMSKLGASLQAITETMPQVTALRLCHRFGDSPLSKLPQELLDYVIDHVQRAARANCRLGWYQDSICWQGTCLPEDHYTVYGEKVEKLWQKIFIDQQKHGIDQATLQDKTQTEKAAMVSERVGVHPNHQYTREDFDIHDDATLRWLDRTCLCSKTTSTATQKPGKFTPLNNVSRRALGLGSSSDSLRFSSHSSVWKQLNSMKDYPAPCSISCQTVTDMPRSRTALYATLPSLYLLMIRPRLAKLLQLRNLSFTKVLWYIMPFARRWTTLCCPFQRSSDSAFPEP